MNQFLSDLDLVWRASKKFVKSAWVSLLIIVLFVLLLTRMGQGSIVLIDLLQSPINTALFLLVSHLLAFVISLYPVYLSKWREVKHEQNNTNWELHDNIFGLGLGIVVFDDENVQEPDTYLIEATLRKLLGVVFYLGLLYVVMYVGNNFFQFPNSLVFWAVAIAILLFNFWISGSKQLHLVKNVARFLPWVIITSILLFFATVISSAVLQWHGLSLLLLFLHLIVSTFHFILFRRYRTKLNKANGALFPYTKFTDSLNYLRLTTLGGWISLLIFIAAQFYVQKFNAAVIIICLFYTLYGIIIIPIKHYFYYRRNATGKQQNPFLYYAFVYFLPIFWIVVFALNIITSVIGNNLHELEPISTSNSVVQHEEFLSAMQSTFSEKDTLYFIATSGGGLRANVWTQLLLEKLATTRANNNSTILESTIAISGVSGGALGAAFYTALHHPLNNKANISRDSIIHNVGNLNALSLDVAWTFGVDYLRELIPYYVGGPDRAKRSMLEYEKVISDTNLMSNLDFQAYWAQVFSNHTANGSFYPALILNSSSYNQKRGIAFTVRSNEQFNAYFPDAINILRLNNSKSLSYLHAISPSNRFPVFSPGAEIPGKGIFLDGGYFENSGMMSIWDVYKQLKSQLPAFFQSKTVVFLQINNGKASYSQELVSPFQDSIHIEVKEMGELSSILRTVLSTTMVSEYFQERLQQNEEVIYTSLYLPYKVDKDRVKKLFFTQELPIQVQQVISENNTRIDSVFSAFSSSDYAEPPLGRLLTNKGVNYMDIVLANDKQLLKDLEDLKDK